MAYTEFSTKKALKRIDRTIMTVGYGLTKFWGYPTLKRYFPQYKYLLYPIYKKISHNSPDMLKQTAGVMASFAVSSLIHTPSVIYHAFQGKPPTTCEFSLMALWWAMGGLIAYTRCRRISLRRKGVDCSNGLEKVLKKLKTGRF